MQEPSQPVLSSVILKVASRCNLNCSYCYVYHKEDQTWRQKPKFMAEEIFDATLERIQHHCARSGQRSISLTFHGGEPTLVGIHRFDRWIRKARQRLSPEIEVDFKLQTNGVLINDEWAAMLASHGVNVGLSMDGPAAIHDRLRIDHRGRGSHESVTRGLQSLLKYDVPFGILSVIQLGADPLRVYRHYLELGCSSISFLLPDYSHDNIEPVRHSFSKTPCADYLIAIFDEWWGKAHTHIRVRNFHTILKLLMGGNGGSDTFGNDAFRFLIVEADGEIEGLDCLRSCAEGITRTGANVLTHEFMDLRHTSPLQFNAIFVGLSKPRGCAGCAEEDSCGGGYLPHRYSSKRGFDNPSVWCADIFRLFSHIRDLAGLDYRETQLRKQALHEYATEFSQ